MDLEEKIIKKTWSRLRDDTGSFKKLLVRDTLDFLDFNNDLDSNIKKLIFEIKSSNYHPQKPYLHQSPKSKGISRPTVCFDVSDALVYRFCIEEIEDFLIEKTREIDTSIEYAIFGGLFIKGKKNLNEETFYEKIFDQYMEYQRILKKFLNSKDYVVSSDISSYFENINILITKDLVRSEVEDKKEIINLLFYFLENIITRNNYEVNTFNGIPQEDIDCSRLIAYYFLHSVDLEIIKFCEENNCKYLRWVDDIKIFTDREVIGKKALRTFTESLRKIGLTASIEKTEINSSAEEMNNLLINENEKLDDITERINIALSENNSTEKLRIEAEILYNNFFKDKKDSGRSFSKLLQRFFTLFSIFQSGILLNNIERKIVQYPEIASEKLMRYLVRNSKHENFESTIIDIINFLYSEENLYPSLETNLLEMLLYLNKKDLSQGIIKKIKILSEDIFFKNQYKSLSEYARAIALLLLFRFNFEKVGKIVKHYLSNFREEDYLLRKYLILVSLTIDNHKLSNMVLEKAKRDSNISISRLVNLVERLEEIKNKSLIKKYLKEEFVYIWKNKINNEFIKEKYISVRAEILKVLIERYS